LNPKNWVAKWPPCTAPVEVIPASITIIADGAFTSCTGLTEVFFAGNAPAALDSSAFSGDNSAVIYYPPGTTGWSSTTAGLSAILWNPQFQTGPSLGVSANAFGFSITGTADIPIVLEACTNLGAPVWQTLQSGTLTNGSLYFSDTNWTNSPVRIYRVRTPRDGSAE